MSDDVSPFNKFILESAAQYLQTVVLVDDQIYEDKSGVVTSQFKKTQTGGRKAALKSVALSPEKVASTTNVEDTEKPDEVSFHDVQNSFAKKHIICSLYQPRKDASFSENSVVNTLCTSADVVVVDWSLHGDDGDKAKMLVRNLIEQSMKDIPHQLRLVLVYTMEVNLGLVADKIYEDLTEHLGKETVYVNAPTKGLVLTTNNSRVVVLGKQENTSLPEYADFFVPGKKLAERTIKEFSQLSSGLLQSIVLRGLANVRKNNRRILMRFQEGIDMAFLTHRALLLPDESFNQIVPLLSDEIKAILEDTIGISPFDEGSDVSQIIIDWCKLNWNPDSASQKDVQKYVGEKNSNKFTQDVLCMGPGIKEYYTDCGGCDIGGLVKTIKKSQWKDDEEERIKLAEYLIHGCKEKKCHQLLGSLMSQRISYEKTPKHLHLGVIIKEVSNKQRYLLCLQPVCDSVRMKGKQKQFIFCDLKVPQNGESITHMVIDASNRDINLQYNPKAFRCFVASFSSDHDSVCAEKGSDEKFVFQDEDMNKYEWIGELKTEHAQRAAEEFGRSLSRVGLTESEWLRLKAKR